MTTIPQFAPGCYGSALAFKEDDSVCMGCVFKAQCQPVHIEARAALRTRLGIVTPEEAKIAKAAAPAAPKAAFKDQSAAALALPKKVQELVDKLDRGGYNVVESLKNGQNPFGAALPYMKIAAHLLIALAPRGKSIDRQLLTTAFVSKLGWQENTSEAHARMAIQALTHIGAVDNIDGAIILRR